MHRAAHAGTHDVAPRDWQGVPKVTGDYDLDASIAHCPNRAMARKIAMYLSPSTYGPRTGYSRYGQGDD